MTLDRGNGCAILAFALAVFVALLFFGDTTQVIWRLLAASAAAGLALGAAKLKGWRPLTLCAAWPSFLIFAWLASELRGAVDANYRGPVEGVDQNWLPITSLFFGAPPFLTFLVADAVALAAVRKLRHR